MVILKPNSAFKLILKLLATWKSNDCSRQLVSNRILKTVVLSILFRSFNGSVSIETINFNGYSKFVVDFSNYSGSWASKSIEYDIFQSVLIILMTHVKIKIIWREILISYYYFTIVAETNKKFKLIWNFSKAHSNKSYTEWVAYQVVLPFFIRNDFW